MNDTEDVAMRCREAALQTWRPAGTNELTCPMSSFVPAGRRVW